MGRPENLRGGEAQVKYHSDCKGQTDSIRIYNLPLVPCTPPVSSPALDALTPVDVALVSQLQPSVVGATDDEFAGVQMGGSGFEAPAHSRRVPPPCHHAHRTVLSKFHGHLCKHTVGGGGVSYQNRPQTWICRVERNRNWNARSPTCILESSSHVCLTKVELLDAVVPRVKN